MSIAETLEKVTHSAASWFVVSLMGGVLWLIRRVFTNQQQIEMLQQSIARDREDFKEVKADVKKLLERTSS